MNDVTETWMNVLVGQMLELLNLLNSFAIHYECLWRNNSPLYCDHNKRLESGCHVGYR